MLDINQIYNEDCLIGMGKIADKSVDMVLCDLPYGTTKCKWDSILPLDKLWENYNRIIKNDGVIALFAQTPFDKILGYSNINMLKYEWIWDKGKPTGHLNSRYAPMKKHENILVFTNNPISYTKKMSPNRYYIDWLLKPVNKTVKRRYKSESVYDVNSNKPTKQHHEGHPVDIVKFNRVQKPVHPTEKPVELCEYLIKLYTKENDLVLDNCIGSGTTAIAAINTNRKFLGFEDESTYYNLAKQRVNDHIIATNMQDSYSQLA